MQNLLITRVLVMLLKIHEQIKKNIEQANIRYKHKADRGLQEKRKFQAQDLLWVHLRKSKFPKLRSNKLKLKTEGPFKVLAKTEDNAYTMDIPDTFGIHPIFNIGNLLPYHGK